MLSFLNIESSKITIYFFGGKTEYNTSINIPLYKEFLILISGPLFQLLFIFIIYTLKNYININTYEKFIYINKILLSFNLLPIINLDGGKLLNIIFNYFFPFSFSFKLSIFISFLLLPTINLFSSKLLNYILMVFILKSILSEFYNFNYIYNKFLLERYLNDYKFKNTIIIDNINKMKRSRNHIFHINNKYYLEKEYLNMYFSKT